MKFRKNDGFTLVELMVTIVIASIVTAAASTVLLLGIRLNNSSMSSAEQQNTTRVFLSVMEKMASSGTIKEVIDDPAFWCIESNEDKVLFCYKADEATGKGTIYSGGTLEISNKAEGRTVTLNGGTPMMEDVIASHITKDEEKSLLTVSVETADGSYTSSVFCRAGFELKSADPIIDELKEDPSKTIDNAVNGKAERAKFLKLLLSQLGSNGTIMKEIKDAEGKVTHTIKMPVFYAQWYNDSWSADTAWCGCYISWVLNEQIQQNPDCIVDTDRVESKEITGGDTKYLWYADVDNFVKFFEKEEQLNQAILNDGNPENDITATNYEWHSLQGTVLEDYEDKPDPGDILFMDWSLKQNDAAHVGVVLKVTDKYVYTIEGNTANTVAVRKYSLDSPVLMGYGVIDWNPDL